MKNGAWDTILSFWAFAYFQRFMLVLGRSSRSSQRNNPSVKGQGPQSWLLESLHDRSPNLHPTSDANSPCRHPQGGEDQSLFRPDQNAGKMTRETEEWCIKEREQIKSERLLSEQNVRCSNSLCNKYCWDMSSKNKRHQKPATINGHFFRTTRFLHNLQIPPSGKSKMSFNETCIWILILQQAEHSWTIRTHWDKKKSTDETLWSSLSGFHDKRT